VNSIECVVRGADRLGECSLWDDATGVLWWVDSRAPALKRFDPSTGDTRVLALSETIGSFAFRARGGMLAALQSGIYALDPDTGAREAIARPEARLPENRFNDGRCDRAGRFWAGTMSDVRREPTGSLYRFAPDGAWAKMRSDIVVPNSLAWSPDNRTMYFADTFRNRIYAYDFDLASGDIRNERVFADADVAGARPIRPDGSCVDADGCLWNCDYGGWRVIRYRPDGRIDREIPLPVGNPTCCCFGGAELDTLYVTSATQRLTPAELAEQPLAGSVFALRPGVQGLPEARFLG
jgi:sugar lactone lactonase YvrE